MIASIGTSVTNARPVFGQGQPSVAVVDDFDRISVDVDGDGKADLSHGEVVSRLINAFLPEVRLRKYSLGLDGTETFEDPRVLETYRKIAGKIGREGPFDALNLSIGVDIPYQQVPYEPEQALTPDSLGRWADNLITWLHREKPLRYGILEQIQRMIFRVAEEHNEPRSYIGAGNTADAQFNLYNLIDGQVAVGATTAKGEKAPYSAGNVLVSRYAQGTFGVRKVAGGFDLSGDERPEVLDSEVSGGTPLVRRFVGRPLQDVLLTAEDANVIHREMKAGKSFYEIDLVYDRLFALPQLQRMGVPAEAVALRANGPELVMLVPRTIDGKAGAEFRGGFTVDPQSRTILYDPDESGRPDLVNHINGTSFAAPKALAADLQTVFARQPGA